MQDTSTVLDPTDASGADGANSGTGESKPRATRQPATKAQQERIAELYESRDYPADKQKPPHTYKGRRRGHDQPAREPAAQGRDH